MEPKKNWISSNRKSYELNGLYWYDVLLGNSVVAMKLSYFNKLSWPVWLLCFTVSHLGQFNPFDLLWLLPNFDNLYNHTDHMMILHRIYTTASSNSSLRSGTVRGRSYLRQESGRTKGSQGTFRLDALWSKGRVDTSVGLNFSVMRNALNLPSLPFSPCGTFKTTS